MDDPTSSPPPALAQVLAALADTTVNLVLVTDAEDRIEWVNASFTRVTGWTLAEVLGRAPHDVLGRVGSVTTWRPELSGAEVELHRRDGTPFWALVQVHPVTTDGGTRHLHIHTDVTALRAAEQRALETTRWLQLATSLFGLGLWRTSLPDGRSEWDANLKSMFGLAPDEPAESLPRRVDELVLPEDLPRLQALRNVVPRPGEHLEIEYRIRRPDGDIRHILSRRGAVDYGTDGRPARMLGAALDVTEQRRTTRQLRDALRRLRLAAEASGIGAWERDLQSGEGTWDPTMFTLLGLLPAERAPSREQTLEMVHPDDREGVRRAWQRMQDEHAPVEYEYRIVRPDGQVVHIVTRAVVERGRDGRAVRAIGTAIDVTEYRRTRAERDVLAERIEFAASALQLGIWEFNPHTRESSWNDQMYALFGHTRESFSELVWTDVLHPDDRASMTLAFARANTTGAPFDVEFRVLLRDGSVRWLASRGRGQLDARGRVLRTVGVNWDITARVASEQAARAAERTARELLQRMRFTTRAAGMGLWEVDLASGSIRWDDQMYLLYGRERDQLTDLGRQWIEIVHPEDRQRVMAQGLAAVEGGAPLDLECRIVLPDGAVRHVANRAQFERDAAGRPVRQYGVTWDITESKLAESALRAKETAERASAAKTEFLSRMSHELRTPLNAVLGFTQLLELDAANPLSEVQRGRIEHIKQAGWHLLTLINEVLDLSRIEAGAARIDMQPVPVAAVIDECMHLVAADAQRREIELSVTLQPGAPAALRADRVRLKQVLLNLLSNAVKYNRHGGWVQVTLRAADDRTRGVLAVRDSGRGISASKMDALFQPFNRLGLESAPIEGTGIGLSIALKLVEQMGGTLEASSEPGVGSEFRVTLQAVDEDGAAAAADRLASAPAAPDTGGVPEHGAVRERADVQGSVLCIEDNAANRDLVAQILKLRPNVTLFTASDGASGRVLAAVCQPDLVLLDMRLPDVDGLTLFSQLRAQRETARVRCVALTANALPTEIDNARRAGIDGYLTKPLQADQLLDCIDAAMAAQR